MGVYEHMHLFGNKSKCEGSTDLLDGPAKRKGKKPHKLRYSRGIYLEEP